MASVNKIIEQGISETLARQLLSIIREYNTRTYVVLRIFNMCDEDVTKVRDVYQIRANMGDSNPSLEKLAAIRIYFEREDVAIISNAIRSAYTISCRQHISMVVGGLVEILEETRVPIKTVNHLITIWTKSIAGDNTDSVGVTDEDEEYCCRDGNDIEELNFH